MGVKKLKIGSQNKRSRNTRTESARHGIQMQPSITERNRKIKRLKHMKRQPNDLQTAKLLT